MIIGIVGNREKEGLREAVVRLVGEIDRTRAEYVIDADIAGLLGPAAPKGVGERCRSAEQCIAECTMVVAFGGDGTILAVARMVGSRSTPILGINLGKLGFLAEVAPDEIEQAVGEIVAGKYNVEERLVLQAVSSATPGNVLFASNDVVVDKSRSSRMISLDVFINGQFAVTYRADGLIVSTPTGSTGYALSSGGPIVVPTSRVLGITPISPHTLSGRPLIVPDTTVIRLVVQGHPGEVLLSTDGQTESVLSPPVEVVITRAEYPLRLVKRVDRSYFDVLRAKLLWGKDARA
jgi:NAD+ kinase